MTFYETIMLGHNLFAKKIPLDILPLKPEARDNLILDVIAQGEVIHEK